MCPMDAPELLAAAAALAPDLTRLRRDVHAEPEIGLDLPRTQQKVLAALTGLPLELTVGQRLTSVVGVLRGKRPGPTVLLRADMDALPLQEATGLSYASKIPGLMHACGHDLHTAMLVGAAHLLCARGDELAGNVIFMFQPGEEHAAGARLMIEEGLLDAAGERPSAAYALHVLSSYLPAGQFATRAGVLTANGDEVHVTVTGVGGHGGVPSMARDPVIAASAMVTALPAHLSRTMSPLEPVVVSVCNFHAGTAVNIIPDEARFDGTIRSLTPQSRQKVLAAIRQVIAGVADAYGVRAEVSFGNGYPACANDPRTANRAAATARDLFGTERMAAIEAPGMAAEDFGFVMAEVPGAFVYLGACPDELAPSSAAFIHTPEAMFNERVLPDGAAFLAALALRRPTEKSKSASRDAISAHTPSRLIQSQSS